MTATEIIERWRRLERQLEGLDPAAAHFATIAGEVEHLRAEYQRVTARAVAAADQLAAAARESRQRLSRSAELSAATHATLVHYRAIDSEDETRRAEDR